MLFSEPKIPQSEPKTARGWIGSVSVLFSEPKIPQAQTNTALLRFRDVSVLFSEPKIPQRRRRARARHAAAVSVLFSEPKIPQQTASTGSIAATGVSVLFSEPKIPQRRRRVARQHLPQGFSALQRAENSSAASAMPDATTRRGFSALQRAENSSFEHRDVAARNHPVSVLFSEPKIPHYQARRLADAQRGFSALQRAENSSRVRAPSPQVLDAFQCSSASRKFLMASLPWEITTRRVSVLFSEPKIPHVASSSTSPRFPRRFSALQRAENSSTFAITL